MATPATSYVTLHPYFTVTDWDKVAPIMDDFVAKTSIEPGCVYFGWTRSGDTLAFREAFVDSDAVTSHLKNTGTFPAALKEQGLAKLESFEIHGPAPELEKLKPEFEKVKAAFSDAKEKVQFFELESGTGQTVLHVDTMKEADVNQLVMLNPRFEVRDWNRARSLMADNLERTIDEPGFLFSDWARDDNALVGRSAFSNAAAVQAHLRNIDDIFRALKEEAVGDLTRMDISGPEAQLRQLMDETMHFSPTFFTTDTMRPLLR